MATTHWRKDYSVTQLFTQPDANWSFHQLARLLLGTQIKEDDLLDALAQKIEFIGSQSRNLPAGEIRQVTVAPQINDQERTNNKVDIKSNKHTVESSHYNLTGLDGPLAEPYSDMIREDDYYGEGAMASFLNIFNNRTHALRYLIHAQTNCTLTSGKASENSIGEFLLALSGHYYPSQRVLHGQRDDTLLALSGHLANSRMTLPTIRKLFDTVLSLPVISMNSLIGRWLKVQDVDHSRLGCVNHRLGSEATLGSRVWDQQAAFELELGPINQKRMDELVPSGALHYKLRDLVAWISEQRIDCYITLICEPDELIECIQEDQSVENRRAIKNPNNSVLTSKKSSEKGSFLSYGAALSSRTPHTKKVRFLLALEA